MTAAAVQRAETGDAGSVRAGDRRTHSNHRGRQVAGHHRSNIRPPGLYPRDLADADTWPAAGLTRSPECRIPREALPTESDHHAGRRNEPDEPGPPPAEARASRRYPVSSTRRPETLDRTSARSARRSTRGSVRSSSRHPPGAARRSGAPRRAFPPSRNTPGLPPTRLSPRGTP